MEPTDQSNGSAIQFITQKSCYNVKYVQVLTWIVSSTTELN